MGKASKRKHERQASKPLPADELALLAKAMSLVLGALTQAHGADCRTYAAVGAEVLSRLGYTAAQKVAGSAAWRVGPGDGDMIAHALELRDAIGTMAAPKAPGAMAGMFHAWIEFGDTIVDFTTSSLPDKARQLDELDQGNTQVDWAPAVLWVDKRKLSSFKHVLQCPDAGVFAYRQHPQIEKVVFEEFSRDLDVETPATAVMMAFASLKAGNELRVVGVGPDADFQTLESARQDSLDRGFKRI